jgi:hypothetical protein
LQVFTIRAEINKKQSSVLLECCADKRSSLAYSLCL